MAMATKLKLLAMVALTLSLAVVSSFKVHQEGIPEMLVRREGTAASNGTDHPVHPDSLLYEVIYEADPVVSEECLYDKQTNMNNWYAKRPANEADCKYRCIKHYSTKDECMHYVFSTSGDGTCKLYNCVPQASTTTYVKYSGRNAYAYRGATNIDSDKTAPLELSEWQCQKRCNEDESCDCVTYERQSGKCWKRRSCEPSDFEYSDTVSGYDVYVRDQVGSNACLTSAGRTVNSHCVGDGGWYALKDWWKTTGCDDDTCMIRCTADGSAFYSDKGEEYGKGSFQTCEQASSTSRNLELSSDRQQCLNELYCWETIEFEDSSVRRACILDCQIDKEAWKEECQEWQACLNNPGQHDLFVKESLELIYHLSIPPLGESQDTVALDQQGCTNPYLSASPEDIECNCWDDMRDSCADEPTQADRYLCLTSLMCNSPAICGSWKADQCGDSTNLLQATDFKTALGKRNAHRAVLMDMQKQQPASIASDTPTYNSTALLAATGEEDRSTEPPQSRASSSASQSETEASSLDETLQDKVCTRSR